MIQLGCWAVNGSCGAVQLLPTPAGPAAALPPPLTFPPAPLPLLLLLRCACSQPLPAADVLQRHLQEAGRQLGPSEVRRGAHQPPAVRSVEFQ